MYHNYFPAIYRSAEIVNRRSVVTPVGPVSPTEVLGGRRQRCRRTVTNNLLDRLCLSSFVVEVGVARRRAASR